MVTTIVFRTCFIAVFLYGCIFCTGFAGLTIAQNKEVRVIRKFSDLPVESQSPIDRIVGNGIIVEMEETRTNQVTEVKVLYLRGNRLHNLIWDVSGKKIIGSSEQKVIQMIMGAILNGVRGEIEKIKGDRQIERIRVKEIGNDGQEFFHVHFIDTDGKRTDIKLDMNGTLLK
ncbi:MAG: hypothetical protein ACUBOA_09165 [Candidatus Loosdrechtia sp.]|uniref:hypothetical protein n=1 Tax=Candidatus Loosdrechtia sp. TaxID=3101272 RepID=UPI003A5D3E75|nr:MAG: hypothetical protein QY305_02700 [Candidatus Jettenia sp. AMX2]